MTSTCGDNDDDDHHEDQDHHKLVPIDHCFVTCNGSGAWIAEMLAFSTAVRDH